MRENIGQRLKKARESKGLSIQKIVEETKISARNLTALESGNFGLFPSETYALGFLRRYARYLNLDDNTMIQRYRNDQMMAIEAPIKELTRKPVTVLDHLKNQVKFVLLGFIVILLIFGIYQGFFNASRQEFSLASSSPNVSFNIRDHLKESGKVPEGKTDSVSFANGVIISLVSKKEGIAFLLERSEIYVILEDLQYDNLESDNNQADLVIYPGKKKISLSEATPSVVNFPWLPNKFKIYILGSTPNNIKIKVEKLGKNELFDEKYLTRKNVENTEDTNGQIINPDNFTIDLVAKTIHENYLELYVDGKQEKRGIIPAGEVLHFKANHSIQIKIGDAGGIDVIINGKPLQRGKKGQQVNKIIRKVKDPLEQLKYRLEIKDS